MPKKEYGLLEQHIINSFKNTRLFEYQKNFYEVIFAGKPRPQGGGECKTDVFVRAREKASDVIRDFKISVKNTNKEFLGNKLKAEDLESYFGPGWEEIVKNATTSLKREFENRPLVYSSGKYPIKANSVTVGWKLEITDKPRTLSVKVPLSDQEIKDLVYKGLDLSDEKKDSVVEEKVIPNSGIAEYLITTSIAKIKSSQDVVDQMELIDDADIGHTYFAFTANNYRTDIKRADGPRALAVRIEWSCANNKMVPKFYYDTPLRFTGERDMAPYVREALETLGKHNADELEPGQDIDYDLFVK